jgi:hypothetical protein
LTFIAWPGRESVLVREKEAIAANVDIGKVDDELAGQGGRAPKGPAHVPSQRAQAASWSKPSVSAICAVKLGTHRQIH